VVVHIAYNNITMGMPLNPMNLHGIPSVNHAYLLETMGSIGFPWFPTVELVDVHWISWDPTVCRDFPLNPTGFPQLSTGDHGIPWVPMVSHGYPLVR